MSRTPPKSETPDLPPAALRALAEAEERRKAALAPAMPTELGGRDGPERERTRGRHGPGESGSPPCALLVSRAVQVLPIDGARGWTR